jgi:hypothetical protein
MYKLNTQVTAIIIAVIIGGSFFVTQVMKQNSIENQKQAEIQAEKERLSWEKSEKATKEFALQLCLDEADETYWDYIRLNGTEVKGKIGVWNATQYDWNEAQKRKEAKEKVCLAKYK